MILFRAMNDASNVPMCNFVPVVVCACLSCFCFCVMHVTLVGLLVFSAKTAEPIVTLMTLSSGRTEPCITWRSRSPTAHRVGVALGSVTKHGVIYRLWSIQTF